MHNSALDIDRNLVLSIDSVKMRWQMVPWKDANHDPQESRYLGHFVMLPLELSEVNDIADTARRLLG